MSQQTKGFVIAMIGIVIWSTTPIFVGYLIETYAMPALLLAFWRNLLVCIATLPALYLIRRSLLQIDRAQVGFYAFFGLTLALFNSIWILSVEANGAAVSTVLAYSSGAFTAILARWFLKEYLSTPKIAAIILSLIGCILVANAYDPNVWRVNPLGIVTGLISGLTFAGYNLMGKEAARRNLNAWTSLLYSFAFASLFTLIFNLLPLPGAAGSFSGLMPDLPVNGWIVLLFLSFFPTLIGFGLYNTAMNYLTASTASLLATSEPAMTAVGAYIFLNEWMTPVQVVGSLVILSAVIMVQFVKE